MRACLALCVAAALVGAARPECGACIQGACYRQHGFPATVDWNWRLAIDRNRNILYVRDGNVLKQCQIHMKQCNTTTDTWDISRLTVDQRTSNTYGEFCNSTECNIYELDLVNKKKKFLVRDRAYDIKFKDKLLYSTFDKGIYTYEDGASRIVAGTKEYDVYRFIVDKNYDIYFVTSLNDKYVIRRLSKGLVDRSVYWDDSHLITDRDGNAVFVHKESSVIYRVTDGQQLVEVGAIADPIFNYAWLEMPLFDNDNNIIYRNNSQDFFHLKRDTDVNCTYSISQNKAIITETVVSTTPYTIETSTSSTRDGDTEDNEDMSPSTPAAESAASTPGESGASHSGTPGQQDHDTGHEQQSSCSCRCPELPNITIKVEFN